MLQGAIGHRGDGFLHNPIIGEGERGWELAEYLSRSWWEDEDTMPLDSVRRGGLWATVRRPQGEPGPGAV